jgi:deoxyribonuclease V
MVVRRWRRFGAVDVHYPAEGGARAALVVATDPRFATLIEEHVAWLDKVQPYEPGRFFVRELPAIRAVLAKADALDVLVIDGYVDLDPDGRPGLGAHVHAEVDIPIVGVAKTAFRAAAHAVAVHRGTARRPLYVTSAGVRVAEAADLVVGMAGQHRIPDALRRVDRLARTGQGDLRIVVGFDPDR